jgi:transposase-like protein
MKNSNQLSGRKGQNGRICKHDYAFRHHVARAYREGNNTAAEIARMFNVTYEQVRGWVREFSSDLSAEPVIAPMTEQEQKEVEALQKQIEILKKKLDYEQLRNFALETMADLAKTELGIDIRKNFGAKQPKE